MQSKDIQRLRMQLYRENIKALFEQAGIRKIKSWCELPEHEACFHRVALDMEKYHRIPRYKFIKKYKAASVRINILQGFLSGKDHHWQESWRESLVWKILKPGNPNEVPFLMRKWFPLEREIVLQEARKRKWLTTNMYDEEQINI